METISQSPVPKKIEVKNEDKIPMYDMEFHEAIKEVISGKKITKLEWDDKEIYGYLKDGVLLLHKLGKDHSWIISEGDLSGDDWIIIN